MINEIIQMLCLLAVAVNLFARLFGTIICETDIALWRLVNATLKWTLIVAGISSLLEFLPHFIEVMCS